MPWFGKCQQTDNKERHSRNLQHQGRNIEQLFYLGDYCKARVRTSSSASSCMLSFCGIQAIIYYFSRARTFPGNKAWDGLLSFSEFYNRISLLYEILESESWWLKDSKITKFCCSSLPFTEVRNMLYPVGFGSRSWICPAAFVQGSYLTQPVYSHPSPQKNRFFFFGEGCLYTGWFDTALILRDVRVMIGFQTVTQKGI